MRIAASCCFFIGSIRRTADVTRVSHSSEKGILLQILLNIYITEADILTLYNSLFVLGCDSFFEDQMNEDRTAIGFLARVDTWKASLQGTT